MWGDARTERLPVGAPRLLKSGILGRSDFARGPLSPSFAQHPRSRRQVGETARRRARRPRSQTADAVAAYGRDGRQDEECLAAFQRAMAPLCFHRVASKTR